MFIIYIIYDYIWMCTMNKLIHIHILVAVPSISFLHREAELKSLETAAISNSLYQHLPKALERGSRQPCPPRLLRTMSEILIWYPTSFMDMYKLKFFALPIWPAHPACPPGLAHEEINGYEIQRLLLIFSVISGQCSTSLGLSASLISTRGFIIGVLHPEDLWFWSGNLSLHPQLETCPPCRPFNKPLSTIGPIPVAAPPANNVILTMMLPLSWSQKFLLCGGGLGPALDYPGGSNELGVMDTWNVRRTF